MKWATGKGESSFCGATYFSCTLGIDEILAIPILKRVSATTISHLLQDFVWDKITTTNRTINREDFSIAMFSVYNELEIVFYNTAEYLENKPRWQK